MLASDRAAVATQFNRDVVELSVVAVLVNTYFDILGTQDRIRIAQDNLRVASRIQNIIKQRVDAGTSTVIDLVQQEYIVAQQRIVISRLTRAVRQSFTALGALLGETPDRVSMRGGSLTRLRVPKVAPGLPSELLLQRPDIREAEWRLAGAAANVASARVSLLPSIKLTADRGYESPLLKTLITPQAIAYNVAANITQPLFDAPRLIAQLNLQKAVEHELLERYRQTIIVALTDVERALIDVRESANEVRLAAEAVEIARRGYRLSETQLDANAIDLTTMLNIQRTLFEALDTLAQARLARFRAVADLYQALGGGWKAIVPATAADSAHD
jgi:NodT family efflux transporter outer membrane factor (OMF) lipoprotein